MEEYDSPWRELSPAGSQRRKLSFNPVDNWVPPVAEEEPVGAFEVSKTKRICKCSNVENLRGSGWAHVNAHSTSRCRRHILPSRRGHSVWLCRYQARTHS
jgi:hypothetical protein